MTTFPKPRPRALEKQDRATRKRTMEEAQNKIVRSRSGGWCEVMRKWVRQERYGSTSATSRCARRASEIHHILGGSGRRGVGESALAKNKLHVCGPCHHLITNHVLQGDWTDVQDRAGTVTFVRVK